MIPFGVVALMFGLFLNARILMKREGRRFTNCLTLILWYFILYIIPFHKSSKFLLITFATYFWWNFSYNHIFLYTLI